MREVRVGYQATGIHNTIGNKGGLMVRMVLEGGESIAFVAVHLAAHEGDKHVQARASHSHTPQLKPPSLVSASRAVHDQ